MNWFLKNKKNPDGIPSERYVKKVKKISQVNNTKTFLIVLFFASIFYFISTNDAKAASSCSCGNGLITTENSILATSTNTAAECDTHCSGSDYYKFNGGSWTKVSSSSTGTTALQRCLDSGGKSLVAGKCTGCPDGKTSNVSGICQDNTSYNASLASQSPAADAHADTAQKEAKCNITDLDCNFKRLLVGVLNLMGWLFSIAATLFSWAIDPVNVSGDNGMLNKQAVKDVWIMVRDLLNMSFILILLFAAFCTIFQVDKWNLKKVWLNILINALLVNFSYPIARFFIDVSNVAFYYFVNHLFDATGSMNGDAILARFGAASNLGQILSPEGYAQFDTAYLMAMIVITFIMGITLLAIAVLFMIRLVALTMIVMFSPIGFVGYIFPSTSSYADKWWSNLFSYSFFAPIMIFVMAISLRIVDAMGRENFASFKNHASNNVAIGGQANWIAEASFFVIPVIILWGGMGIAKSFGIAGSDAVIGGAQKFSKWAGNNLTGLRTAKWFATKATPAMVKAGAKKFERDVLAKRGLSPRAFLEAWNANTKSAEETKIGVATGAWRDRLNKMWSRGKDVTHFKDAAFQANVLKKAKELGDVNQESEYLMSEYENARNKKDTKTMAAVLRMMFSNNDQNEYMKIKGLDVDPHLMKKTMFAELHGAGMTSSDAAKQLSDYSEIAVSKGNYANYGMASYEKNAEGKFEFKVSGDDDQDNAAAGKARNVKAQSKADTWHWNSFCIENESIEDSQIEAEGDNVIRNKKGEIVRNAKNKAMRKIGKLHEVGLKQLENLTPAEVNSANRVRTDFYNILKREGEIREFASKLRGEGKGDKADNILAFIETLKEGKFKDIKKTT